MEATLNAIERAIAGVRSKMNIDPGQLRETLIGGILDASGADAVALFRMARVEGEIRVSSVDHVGDRTLCAPAVRHVDGPIDALTSSRVDRPSAAFFDRWSVVYSGAHDWHHGLGPLPRTQVRGLVFDTDACLGDLVLAWRDRCDAHAALVATALSREVAHVRRVLVAAERHDGAQLRDVSCFQCLLDEDGALSGRALTDCPWLDAANTDQLGELGRRFLADRHDFAVSVLNGAELRLTRLDGAGGAVVHVAIQPAERVSLAPDHHLTERQSEIAAMAAEGHTVNQIGETLGISPNTVKHHLKDVYRILEVTSRVELRATLNLGDDRE